jgi:hypothetical protein
VDVCSSGRDVFAIHFRQTIRNKSACPKRFLVCWSERPRVGLSFFTVSAFAEIRVAGRRERSLDVCLTANVTALLSLVFERFECMFLRMFVRVVDWKSFHGTYWRARLWQ